MRGALTCLPCADQEDAQRDPLVTYPRFLIESGAASAEELQALRDEVDADPKSAAASLDLADQILKDIKSNVEQGATFSDSLARHPRVFDELFVNLVAAGEAGGILDTILKRLATYIEKAVKLKSQVKSAMIYPVAIIVIAGLVVTVILWKVIPTFATLFAGLGAPGLRPRYHANYYAAFVFDPDGHNIEAVCHEA